MRIQKYKAAYFEEVMSLFYECVHTINAKDYNKQQLEAWTSSVDQEKMKQSLLHRSSYVAMKDNQIIGFANIDIKGYLDMLYVHKNYQRKGVATLLCDELESVVKSSTIITNASITAKSFFENRGYQVIKKQEVIRQGISVVNYEMKKTKEYK